MAGDGLVVSDHPQGKTQARALNEPADQEDEHGQREQVPEDRFLRDVDEDVAAHGAADIHLEPGHELADQLGEAEGEDHEIDA